MRLRNIIIFTISIIILIYLLLQTLAFYPNNKEKANKFFAKGNFPLVIAHGGAKLEYPENTIYAFEKNVERGVDVLEIDLRLTKDDKLITHHNATIDETSDHQGLVRDYTYSELLNFNFGYHFVDYKGERNFTQKQDRVVPALIEDLFKKYQGKVLFILEIKDKGDDGIKAAKLLQDLIVKYHLQQDVCVASFNQEALDAFDYDGLIKSATEAKIKPFVYGAYLGYDFATQFKASGLQLPMNEKGISLDNKYLIYKIAKHQLFVHYWTINNQDEMRKLIENKVDGIITDRVDLLLELKEEYSHE